MCARPQSWRRRAGGYSGRLGQALGGRLAGFGPPRGLQSSRVDSLCHSPPGCLSSALAAAPLVLGRWSPALPRAQRAARPPSRPGTRGPGSWERRLGAAATHTAVAGPPARRRPNCGCAPRRIRRAHPPRPGIEDLRDKREEINRQILKEDEEKAKVSSRRARGGRCERSAHARLLPLPFTDPERLGCAHQAALPPERLHRTQGGKRGVRGGPQLRRLPQPPSLPRPPARSLPLSRWPLATSTTKPSRRRRRPTSRSSSPARRCSPC